MIVRVPPSNAHRTSMHTGKIVKIVYSWALSCNHENYVAAGEGTREPQPSHCSSSYSSSLTTKAEHKGKLSKKRPIPSRDAD